MCTECLKPSYFIRSLTEAFFLNIAGKQIVHYQGVRFTFNYLIGNKYDLRVDMSEICSHVLELKKPKLSKSVKLFPLIQRGQSSVESIQGSYTFSRVKFKHFHAFSSFSSTLQLWQITYLQYCMYNIQYLLLFV